MPDFTWKTWKKTRKLTRAHAFYVPTLRHDIAISTLCARSAGYVDDLLYPRDAVRCKTCERILRQEFDDVGQAP